MKLLFIIVLIVFVKIDCKMIVFVIVDVGVNVILKFVDFRMVLFLIVLLLIIMFFVLDKCFLDVWWDFWLVEYWSEVMMMINVFFLWVILVILIGIGFCLDVDSIIMILLGWIFFFVINVFV